MENPQGLSVGKCIFPNNIVNIVDDDGNKLGVGEKGELCIAHYHIVIFINSYIILVELFCFANLKKNLIGFIFLIFIFSILSSQSGDTKYLNLQLANEKRFIAAST